MTDPFEAAGVRFDNSFVRDLQGLSVPFTPAIAPAPQQLALNAQLAGELGLDADALATAEGVAVLVGNLLPAGAHPVAQAYAGHQFGNYSPRLGDGRAVLVGEVIDVHGRRRDIHLKGAGRTPFSRGGDGKAAVGPMLREYVIGEAMYALGIPTTRMLAVTATGDKVVRDTVLPGAVLARVASSHLRVGTFQYAASLKDPSVLRGLADYAIARHYPDAADAENPYLAFFEAVLDAQASLVARWMLVGFIHGVLNTDNVTISGETIDYGPCAFMDSYDPMTVFSSIDQTGRYAYANQPLITPWNLARLAEPLLPLIDHDPDTAIAKATAALETFADRYQGYWLAGMRSKLGLVGAVGEATDTPDEATDTADTATDTADATLVAELLSMMQAQSADFTLTYRALSNCVRGTCDQAHALFSDRDAFDAWHDRWLARLSLGGADLEAVATAMDAVNPLYIPRNHLVEEALAAATDGDLEPFEDLLHILSSPFTERSGIERFTEPAPAEFGRYQTFCGT